jgi:UDP-N-acetylglucosamine 2-epimerase (non-hydrolysing)
MSTILCIFGTRPEAIKMCPLVLELKGRRCFRTAVCATGQHREMLSSVLSAFGVVPDFALSAMQKGQSLSELHARLLLGVGEVISEASPDLVLVHGDTATAHAAALAAFFARVPVGHVEAGLRTYNISSPYPEEFNRRAIALLANYHFAPTPLSRRNLLGEGVAPASVFVTGNTAIDALATTVREDYTHPALSWAEGSRLVLVTAHRRENLGEPMRKMFRAIRRVIGEVPDVKAICPIHKNPAVRRAAEEELGGCDRLRIIEPLDVLDFHNFLARSHLILTDSGGIQEEAPSLGKPVLVMRDTTERPEALEAGTVRLVGTSYDKIMEEVSRLLDDEAYYAQMSHAVNPYGDGLACGRIVDFLK